MLDCVLRESAVRNPLAAENTCGMHHAHEIVAFGHLRRIEFRRLHDLLAQLLRDFFLCFLSSRWKFRTGRKRDLFCLGSLAGYRYSASDDRRLWFRLLRGSQMCRMEEYR